MKSISDNDIENNININLLPLQSEPLCSKIIYFFILGMFAITLIVSLILIFVFSL
jgi:hypothetical protein